MISGKTYMIHRCALTHPQPLLSPPGSKKEIFFSRGDAEAQRNAPFLESLRDFIFGITKVVGDGSTTLTTAELQQQQRNHIKTTFPTYPFPSTSNLTTYTPEGLPVKSMLFSTCSKEIFLPSIEYT